MSKFLSDPGLRLKPVDGSFRHVGTLFWDCVVFNISGFETLKIFGSIAVND